MSLPVQVKDRIRMWPDSGDVRTEGLLYVFRRGARSISSKLDTLHLMPISQVPKQRRSEECKHSSLISLRIFHKLYPNTLTELVLQRGSPVFACKALTSGVSGRARALRQTIRN